MAEPDDSAPHGDVNLAEDGDIILRVQKGTYLRVRSSVLSDSSPVFKVMLGANFREGQGDRSAAEPKVIQLPEDDEDGMTTLCEMLHNKFRCDKLTAYELWVVARLADKYNCVAVVSIHTEAVLSRYYTFERATLEDSDPALLRFLTAAAYLLDHDWFFHDFTQRFVLDHTIEYNLDVHDPSSFLVPVSIIRDMQIQRTAIRLAIHEDIVILVNECPEDDYCLPPYNELLPAIGAHLGPPDKQWPPRLRETPIRGILNRMLEGRGLYIGYCSHHRHRGIEAGRFKEFAQETIDSAGLKLKDVKGGLRGLYT